MYMASVAGGVVVVTGATGFVGRRLCPRLTDSGQRVIPLARGLGRDVLAPDTWRALDGERVDAVVHLAAATFVPDSWARPGHFYELNTLGTQRVLDWCAARGARLVYLSAYLYGQPHYNPIDEGHTLAPDNPYAHSKWLGEELCRFYSAYRGVPTAILRPFNLFGPGQDERFLVPSVLGQLRDTGHITVKDDRPRRDFVHVDDLVDACVRVLAAPPASAVFNVGSGRSLSVGDVLEVVRRAARRRVEVTVAGEPRPNEIMDTVADCRAITAALGWRPRQGLEAWLEQEVPCVCR
jgi:nucleoside-diphosphate-sugar epimerase